MEKRMECELDSGSRARAWIKVTRLALIVVLTGCAASKEAVLPTEGPTMAEVYAKHMQESEAPVSTMERHLPADVNTGVERGAFTRTALDEIDNRFARLPNPDLFMYVAPHLAGKGRYPVPGYMTVFPMYETVEYAMPGEVKPRRVKIDSQVRKHLMVRSNDSVQPSGLALSSTERTNTSATLKGE